MFICNAKNQTEMCGKIFVQEKHPLESYAIVEFEKKTFSYASVWLNFYIHLLCT